MMCFSVCLDPQNMQHEHTFHLQQTLSLHAHRDPPVLEISTLRMTNKRKIHDAVYITVHQRVENHSSFPPR